MWVCSQLLEAQADYHRKALAVLEKALPEMRAHQGNVPGVLADASSASAASAFFFLSFFLFFPPNSLHVFPLEQYYLPQRVLVPASFYLALLPYLIFSKSNLTY